ncbi:hypothetical protein GPECTOR_64g123 [Gonium pectorale]|uniref:BRO1 domain-containing protein n=1 Tax=Gonium pectorale TaxID=33097 RepID=A0A150G414_GONPE|nr:hypothetical protein GPECTOR_64g123 [Gonium pectorale]|eukprot:KXZ44629.1 hypothetical protein GPECTOR_64g123 [Gonium pectorale]
MAALDASRVLPLPFYDPLLLSTKPFDYYALAKQVYTLYAATLRHTALQRLDAAAAAAAAPEPSAAYAAAASPSPTPLADGGGGGSGGGASPGPGPGAGSGAAALLTAAVGGLRRAAGVYGYLAESLLPELPRGGGGGDRPLELLPPAARLMQQLCLAEAQALMAAAAAAKGLSAGAQRSLHAGCVTLLRGAEDSARELVAACPPGLPPCERLVRLLGASAGLHAGRAALLLAAERQKALELGEAEAACEEGGRLLEGALRRLDRSDPPAWAETLRSQQAALAPLLAAVHKDRLAVTFQALPRSPPDPTANGAVRVAAEAFTPAPVTPPAPPPEQAAKGGCALM